MAAPTAIEKSLFEQLYPVGGWAACAAVMPGKKKGWITQWAWRMGLTEPMGDMDDPTPVPAHDYTAADHAMREWGAITRTGQLRPIVTVELEKVA